MFFNELSLSVPFESTAKAATVKKEPKTAKTTSAKERVSKENLILEVCTL